MRADRCVHAWLSQIPAPHRHIFSPDVGTAYDYGMVMNKVVGKTGRSEMGAAPVDCCRAMPMAESRLDSTVRNPSFSSFSRSTCAYSQKKNSLASVFGQCFGSDSTGYCCCCLFRSRSFDLRIV
eukprot:SAG11_NODE_104_length_16539_cov_8.526642_4_plen_124_part_00